MVFAVDRDERGLRALGEASSGRCEIAVVDLAHGLDAERLVADAIERLGGVDVLINNAGIGYAADLVDTTDGQWEDVFAVNVTAPFRLCRACVPHMVRQGGGVVVNVASAAALSVVPNRAAYCASKAALIALTKSIAIDFATRGVRANCIAPGTVDSPWIGRILDGDPEPEARLRAMEARQVVGRLGTPEEIADAVVFAASDRSTFMHGSALVVDGGFTAA